jgi:hypothetical protein
VLGQDGGDVGVEMGGVVQVFDIGAVDSEDVIDASGHEVIDNEINHPAPGSARCSSMLVISGHTFLPTASFNKIHQLRDEVSCWFKTEEPRPRS